MRRSQRAGMAVVEFIGAVVAILLAVFAFYYYANNYSEQNKRSLTVRRMTTIEAALQKYCVDCGGCLPTTEQGLAALVAPPRIKPISAQWRGPYLTDPACAKDGWGCAFHYQSPGAPLAPGATTKRPYDLSSQGRDNSEGGEGLDRDLQSWDRSTMVP